ncbi:hypothetical protein [Fructobacillus durionis]|uniref:Uncharacterized protein n=1 Tax=Fructobacillus durionis TaxID=283737 RepID=A0A1I1G7W4_9LACO|nr:hypothetical protein [Fructobacillus durionis]SFC07446.1 hypothetical protein SAMN05660453_1011 [Fructobacillus durionis]
MKKQTSYQDLFLSQDYQTALAAIKKNHQDEAKVRDFFNISSYYKKLHQAIAAGSTSGIHAPVRGNSGKSLGGFYFHHDLENIRGYESLNQFQACYRIFNRMKDEHPDYSDDEAIQASFLCQEKQNITRVDLIEHIILHYFILKEQNTTADEVQHSGFQALCQKLDSLKDSKAPYDLKLKAEVEKRQVTDDEIQQLVQQMKDKLPK